ncbi:hypothetical protein [Deinococcus humi]|uniref:Uncharacterized protein n=1 Tax=Deinococcus humi TaxID=662880 RepID=A0A7W8JUL2_9DEIO|nr:hypothetical protein [Deinococcus humi]MBB5362253.1 hypothetical protein [Deinococcus humi]GGO21335.1 hypothetical protein GCM10008949_07460 [Deinococcus humi]
MLGDRLERLTGALSREGYGLRAEVDPTSLAALDASLQSQDVVLELQTLRRVAWAALGQASPQRVRLTTEARARLSHLTDLRDVFSPADAERVGREFAGERWLAPDLLAARPWLDSRTPPKEVVPAVMQSQWSGLVGLLGEHGPWVYTANVADLQLLGRLYGELVRAASQAQEDQALDAALGQADQPSLLARLEATDYRQSSGTAMGVDLATLESAFWDAAKAQARRDWEGWQTRHGR